MFECRFGPIFAHFATGRQHMNDRRTYQWDGGSRAADHVGPSAGGNEANFIP